MFVRNYLFGILLLMVVSSCREDRKDAVLEPDQYFCHTKNPLEDLGWLKEMKNTFELNEKATGAQIIGYKYQGNDVFLINGCVGCTDEMWQVYDCSGKVICQFGGIAGLNTCPDFFETATDSTLLYNNVQR
jgi:hypothetical protein